jgi:hypothetical protein
MRRPIEEHWNKILARMPSAEERENADLNWRSLFYAGARAMFDVIREGDGPIDEQIEAVKNDLEIEEARLLERGRH